MYFLFLKVIFHVYFRDKICRTRRKNFHFLTCQNFLERVANMKEHFIHELIPCKNNNPENVKIDFFRPVFQKTRSLGYSFI